MLDLSYNALRRAYSIGELSPKELTDSLLNEAERVNPSLNCFITICHAEALADAKRAEELLRSGKATPLTGLPIAVKDNIAVKGVPMTCGSRILENYVPDYDATAVAALKAAGAVIIGKTNMDEFAMGSTGATSVFGPTRNPAHPGCTPGGSSSGSAAAVAAGLVTLALGSDTGGSVRLPAHCCNTIGLSPTYGRISRFGLTAYASSLDRIGILSHSADAISDCLHCIEGKDSRDATTVTCTEQPYIIPKKAGIIEELTENLSSEAAHALDEAVRRLEHIGIQVKTVSLPSLHTAVQSYYVLACAESAANLARYDGISSGNTVPGNSYSEILQNTRSAGFGREVKLRIAFGNYVLREGYRERYYLRALELRRALTAEVSEVLNTTPLLINATYPVTAISSASTALSAEELYRLDEYTVLPNIAGLCSVSVPYSGCGISYSLPPMYDDILLSLI